MITPRRRARQFVVQALYQSQLNPSLSMVEIERNIHENEVFAKADEALFKQIFFNVYNHQQTYIQDILPLLDRKEEDLNPVERSVLLMAYYELAHMPETPYPVIINEAIEITKIYGGTDGYKFVNGILDKLANQLRPNDPVRKDF